MIVIGVDPGTARIGWGVIKIEHFSPIALAYGLIETDKDDSAEKRLNILYDAMTLLLQKYKPDVMSIEDLYFATNAKTAIAVGQARGIILLSAAKQQITTASFSPLAIKRTITGDGHADKRQVGQMIVKLLHLTSLPKPDDTADALAIALTYAYTKKFK